ncbi:MAG: FAD-binding oxidoreductase, partial [Vicinamibacterales bacterium]
MSSSHIVRCRAPRGRIRQLPVTRDPDVLSGLCSDAAHFPGGFADGVAFVESEADVATALREARAVLAIGAQSSLTGGATPHGELLLSFARMKQMTIGERSARVQAGVTLDELDAALAPQALCYPPAPTFTGATVGGVISTNAAGPSTFKHGPTRPWVERLTVVLASGDVIEIERGEYRAHADGYFVFRSNHGDIRVPVPPIASPDVPKCSAGYALARDMDVIDLFIGAEGSLGVVTEATLRLQSAPPAHIVALVRAPIENVAVQLAAALRTAAHTTWRSGDRDGIDVSAIEHADGRAVSLLVDDRADADIGIDIGRETGALLWVALDVAEPAGREQLWQQVESALDRTAADSPVRRFCLLLDHFELLDRTELAFPDEAGKHAQFRKLREAIPLAVNRRIAQAQHAFGPSVAKAAGDFIVPFAQFGNMVAACRDAAASRHLDMAIWGHLSDGNIHPNILPRCADDMALAYSALLEAGL